MQMQNAWMNISHFVYFFQLKSEIFQKNGYYSTVSFSFEAMSCYPLKCFLINHSLSLELVRQNYMHEIFGPT